MKKVTLVRGIPGSGKSTFVKSGYNASILAKESWAVCSADDFFTNSSGEYLYDRNRVGEAHKYCRGEFFNAINRGVDHIFLDNTFVKFREMEDYYIGSIRAGYDVEIVYFVVNTIDQIKICAVRCVHSVPQMIVARMAVDFEIAEKHNFPRATIQNIEVL